MTKDIFLEQLRTALLAAKISNVDSLIDYYNEMICDRMEDGMDEELAIEALGSVDEIINELNYDKPIGTLVKDKVTTSHNTAKDNGKSTLWIALTIIGAPLWIPILLTILILLGVFYLIPWILIITFFTVLASLGIAALAGVLSFVYSLTMLDIGTAVISLGIALILGPVTIILIKPVLYLAKATLRIGARFLRFVKRKMFR